MERQQVGMRHSVATRLMVIKAASREFMTGHDRMAIGVHSICTHILCDFTSSFFFLYCHVCVIAHLTDSICERDIDFWRIGSWVIHEILLYCDAQMSRVISIACRIFRRDLPDYVYLFSNGNAHVVQVCVKVESTNSQRVFAMGKWIRSRIEKIYFLSTRIIQGS